MEIPRIQKPDNKLLGAIGVFAVGGALVWSQLSKEDQVSTNDLAPALSDPLILEPTRLQGVDNVSQTQNLSLVEDSIDECPTNGNIDEYKRFLVGKYGGVLFPSEIIYTSPSSLEGLAVFADPVDNVHDTFYGYHWTPNDPSAAASWEYEPCTVLLVTNINNGKTTKVIVKAPGPDRIKHPDRMLNLSFGAFSSIADPMQGVANVRIVPESG